MADIIVQVDENVYQVIDSDTGLIVNITDEIITPKTELESIVFNEITTEININDGIDEISIIEPTDELGIKFAEVLIVTNPNPADGELEVPYNVQVDFVDSDLIYKGWADPGSATSSPVWRIQRMTFVGSDEDLVLEWAEGNGNFNNVWNDRAGLSYS